jgi:dipeptidyl aminopeptidase/acylaminoacyl peptidase
MPHGGPYEIQDEWGYDTETQILAAHGYAVLRVNFRGSGGYGRDFVEAGFRQWGRRMQDDLTEATRWAVREAGIDDKRICLWGASYGGYAALMGVVREPGLYRCTIAASAVTDLRISWKWGDIRRRESGRIYLERVLGKDPQELYEYSPTKHAGKIDVPVLLVHGQRDDRVPFEHFKAMNKALIAAGKPPRTVVYGDETHGVSGTDNRREYYIEVLNFLAEHLGGAKPRLE